MGKLDNMATIILLSCVSLACSLLLVWLAVSASRVTRDIAITLYDVIPPQAVYRAVESYRADSSTTEAPGSQIQWAPQYEIITARIVSFLREHMLELKISITVLVLSTGYGLAYRAGSLYGMSLAFLASIILLAIVANREPRASTGRPIFSYDGRDTIVDVVSNTARNK